MENPATWKQAELVIADALEEIDQPKPGFVAGFSRQAFIAARLRLAGLLDDAAEPEIGWEGLARYRAGKSDP